MFKNIYFKNLSIVDQQDLIINYIKQTDFYRWLHSEYNEGHQTLKIHSFFFKKLKNKISRRGS